MKNEKKKSKSKEENLMEVAKVDPVRAISLCKARVQVDALSAQKRTRKRLAEAYASAYYLSRDPARWKEFIKDGFWNKRVKKPKQKHMAHDCLKTVLVYVYEAIGKANYDRAYKYSVALADYFNTGTKPEDIEAIIEKHGIENMINEGMQSQKGVRARAKGATRADLIFDDAVEEDDFSLDETKSEKKYREARKRKKKYEIIGVKVSKALSEKLSSLPAGEEMIVRFRSKVFRDAIGRLLEPKVKEPDEAEAEKDESASTPNGKPSVWTTINVAKRRRQELASRGRKAK